MTLPEFLAVLARAPFTWAVTDVGLRSVEMVHSHCPVTAVCEVVTGAVFESCDAAEAGFRLGLELDLTCRVMAAADTRRFDDIRRELLVATRVQAEGA